MNDVTSKNQFFFDFGRDFDAKFENFFFTQENKIIQSEILNLLSSEDKQDILLFGSPKSGKTFLLNSILNEDAAATRSSIYVDCAKIGTNQNIFDRISSKTLICIDNIDQSDRSNQVEIFNLINETKDSNTKLIVSTNTHLSELEVFADLKSRLQQIKFFTLHPISDQDVNRALEFIGTKLNLNFNDDIYKFLATRIRRDFSTMKDTLIALDRFMYAEKKQPSKKTVADFLKQSKN